MFSRLQRKAAESGLKVGVIPAGSVFERGWEILERRKEKGWKTPFVTACLEAQCYPLKVFPQARSIVVVACPWYYPADGPPGPTQGIIAMSGRGEDYHRVLTRVLEPLTEWLKAQGANWTFIQVDKGPLLEREAAYYSGLGYYGYNCSLIVPGWGSRVALGLVVTDLEIEPTLPAEDQRCGSCGRCLAACPTGALVSPYMLQPERCLSYFTQKRGFLPPEVRPYLGQRLFGCDVCQDVCPENEGLRGEGVSFTYPDLIEILKLDREKFAQLFGCTALAWRGRTVLQRNAAIGLGNVRIPSEAVLYALGIALTSPSPIVRGHAVWALGRLGVLEARQQLVAAYEREGDPGVKAEIREALNRW
ncbi:MAG: tRNA epoxyqueuosine(34) reductase QueG [Moorellaceae bacterium]